MNRNNLKDVNLVEHLISIPNCLDWILFFLIFSRLEYALKRAKYIKGNGKYIEADWERFGSDIEKVFTEQKDEELSYAIDFLKNKPPKKQILKDGQLDWDCPNENKSEIHTLIDAIKRVRNNLFHGGKYPSQPVTDPSRDRDLIKHSITVLKYLLYSSEQVKEHYFHKLELE